LLLLAICVIILSIVPRRWSHGIDHDDCGRCPMVG
jgi:hypothetical protein